MNVVQPELRLHLFGKVGEAAGDEYGLYAVGVCGLDQFVYTGIGAQAISQHVIEQARGCAGEKGHAAAQAFVEVGDFAAHGGFGDGGDFGFFARQISDFVDALNIDEGGVHVHREDFEIGPSDVAFEAGNVNLLCVGMFDQFTLLRCGEQGVAHDPCALVQAFGGSGK